MKPLTRAHRRFIRWEPYVGLLLATGFFSFVGKGLKVFGDLGWPEAIFLGTAAAAVLTIALAAGLAGWRYFRLTSDATVPAFARSSGAADLEQRLSDLEKMCPDAADRHFWDNNLQAVADHNQRLAMVEASHRAIIDDYQHMRGLEARFSGELDGLKEVVRTEDEGLRQHLQVLEGKLAKLKATMRSSIHAIWMREQIAELVEGIRRDAADLNHRVSERQQHDKISWDRWENVYGHWNSLMVQWWVIARFYLANTGQVLQVPDHMYPGTEVDEALLTPGGGAEAVRLYKKFRIIQDQWEAVQEELHKNMVLVAFHGMPEEEVRNGQPVEQG